jgi:PAS domain S-box-containing protein
MSLKTMERTARLRPAGQPDFWENVMSQVDRWGSSALPASGLGDLTGWFSPDLIEILPAAVYVCNADAVVVAYNRRAAELWGREPAPGDTDEKYCGSHRLYHPDGTYLPHHQTPMEQVLRTAKPARDMEVIIERPNGSQVTVLVNIAPLFDEDDKLVGAVNCFQDLTANKQAEQERVRLRDQLHQAQKMEALGQLTAGLAHDFNNLIHAIAGNLEFAVKRVTDSNVNRVLVRAQRAADLGAKLVAHILAFSRHKVLNPKPADLNEVIVSMADMLAQTLGGSILIKTKLASDLWPAAIDPSQLELAIVNLAVNARDAMPDGGTLTIETRNVAAGSEASSDLPAGDCVRIIVSDTGQGMSEEVLARVFEPFFTTKAAGKGTGLGLGMVRGAAIQLGGNVTVGSRPGHGTSVSLWLPRADPEPAVVTISRPDAG